MSTEELWQLVISRGQWATKNRAKLLSQLAATDAEPELEPDAVLVDDAEPEAEPAFDTSDKNHRGVKAAMTEDMLERELELESEKKNGVPGCNRVDFDFALSGSPAGVSETTFSFLLGTRAG